jgi:hypothetical protein
LFAADFPGEMLPKGFKNGAGFPDISGTNQEFIVLLTK